MDLSPQYNWYKSRAKAQRRKESLAVKQKSRVSFFAHPRRIILLVALSRLVYGFVAPI